MRRTFSEHFLRPVISLDGLWNLEPQDGSGKMYPAMVPGVWERIPQLTSFRGIGKYTRNVRISQPGNYLLRFGAVSHTARVLWDGQAVGGHYNAFTGFDVLLTNAEAGIHSLCVEVDNRFTENSTLLTTILTAVSTGLWSCTAWAIFSWNGWRSIALSRKTATKPLSAYFSTQ